MPYRTPSQKMVGDPGIFGTIGKILGTAGRIIPGPIGGAIGAVGGILAPKRRPTPEFRLPTMPGGSTPTLHPTSRRPPPPGAALGPVGAMAQQPRKRRRMDPMNVKALRRATRRLAAFDREKKKVEKQLRAIAPKPQRRSRRDLGPGHTHTR